MQDEPATPVPDMVDAVDREAAAGIAQLHFLYPTDTIDRIRSGELDHLAIVKRCARHRIAALTACRVQVEREMVGAFSLIAALLRKHDGSPSAEGDAFKIADATFKRHEHRSAE